MADPSLQESLYKLSVRKYFTEQLEGLRGKPVYFDRQYSIPKDAQGNELTNWVVVGFNGIDIDTISTGMLEVICFSRKDEGGIVLSDLRDTIVDMMIDEDMPDGCRRIPYIDATHAQVGGMIGFIDTKDSGVQYGADGTMFKILHLSLKWGTK